MEHLAAMSINNQSSVNGMGLQRLLYSRCSHDCQSQALQGNQTWSALKGFASTFQPIVARPLFKVTQVSSVAQQKAKRLLKLYPVRARNCFISISLPPLSQHQLLFCYRSVLYLIFSFCFSTEHPMTLNNNICNRNEMCQKMSSKQLKLSH